MDLGKPIKVVEVPLRERTPLIITRAPDDGGLIPLPDDWPRRSPATVPAGPDDAGRREQTQRAG